jgi:SAM-dependent methyltransferase
MTRDGNPNREQAAYWNEEAGQRWVAMQRDIDAQLEPFGRPVMDELELAAGTHVLDVGCGAGATSLMLAAYVRPGRVVGVDISAALLERARARGEAIDNLQFELADAQIFAFAPATFDAIFSRFGVMFFGDPVAAFANLRAAVRPGGELGFVCWRAMDENPAFVLPLTAGLPFLPEPPAPPEPDAPGPFAFADAARVRTILERAGWAEIDVTAHDTDLVFAGRSDMEGAIDLALQIGPLARALSTFDAAMHAQVRDAVREAFAPHHGPAGVVLPAATWIVTARRPS